MINAKLKHFQILERVIRVDHVLNYKPPKDNDEKYEIDEMTQFLREEGCAPQALEKLKDIAEKKSVDSSKFKIKEEPRSSRSHREDSYIKSRSDHKDDERRHHSTRDKYREKSSSHRRRATKSRSRSRTRSNSPRHKSHKSSRRY